MMRRVLLYTSLIIGLLIETVAFATAKTYTQLGIATFFYLVLAFSFLNLFPRKPKKEQPAYSPGQSMSIAPTYSKHEDEEENVGDHDKRAFLHLIWTAGIAFFIYSIVSKKAELSFFGKATGTGIVALEDSSGNKINPAKEQPTDGYIISDIDDKEMDFVYYGYTKTNGNWYIAKQDLENGTFRYSKGERDFPAGWNNRTKLKYDYFYNILL